MGPHPVFGVIRLPERTRRRVHALDSRCIVGVSGMTGLWVRSGRMSGDDL